MTNTNEKGEQRYQPTMEEAIEADRKVGIDIAKMRKERLERRAKVIPPEDLIEDNNIGDTLINI